MNSVLITGGSGFLGNGLVRELMRRGVHRICIFSRDEAKQAKMRAEIPDPDARLHWFVGDVRDHQRLVRAMRGVDTVIHAAALKRIQTGEYDPAEIVKTNVLGTMNVIDAAIDAPLEAAPAPRRLVYISTDKAAAPFNCYGASKLMGEKLVLGAHNARGKYGPVMSVVRYGNVAGSTGSVIPTWRDAMKAGKGGIWITEPDATRFWMRLDQAIDLVLEVAQSALGGSVWTPDLPAYRLGDLAEAMNIPRPIEIRGLGQGEKLHERMLEDGPDSSQVRRMTIEELREALQHV